MSRTSVPPSFRAPCGHVTRVFGGHPFQTDGEPLALAFAGDGTLWSVEEPGVLRRWDLDGRRQLGWHHLEELATLWAFDNEARWLASATDDLSVWDVQRGELEISWPQPCWVTAVAFRPGAEVLAAGYDDGMVRLWDWRGKRLLHEIRGDSAVSSLAFTADGGRLAAAGEDRVIRLWDANTGRPLGDLVGHTDRIPALAWRPDGSRLYSAGWDTTARVWDVRKREPIILLNSHAGQVVALALSADGSRLACADSADTIHIWDATLNREIGVTAARAGEVRALAFGPDGRRLASAGAEHVIRLWDSETGREEGRAADAAAARACVALSPDSRRLVALAPGAAPGVWHTADAAPASVPEDAGALRAFAASPDGRWVAGSRATGDAAEAEEATLTLWEAATGRRVARLERQAGPVTALAFSGDSGLLATGGPRGDVWLWAVPEGRPVLVVGDAAARRPVEALAFHPRRPLLAVGGVDWLAAGGVEGAVVLWDVQTRQQAAVFAGGAVGLAFHPDGRRLAAASTSRALRVWDIRDGAIAAEWPGHTEAVTCVAYSPDGRLLASGGDDLTARLWDADTGAARAVASLDTQVKALCFSPDGRRLYTGNGNGSCYELDVPGLLADGV